MVNLPTKFKVSTFTLNGDMKGVKTEWFGVGRGHPRSSAMSPFDRAHTISYSSLIETMHLSYGVLCVILCVAVLIQYRLVTDRHKLDIRP